MYPKVYSDFAKAADTYGPVSVLPTPVFFYGLPVGEEILIEMEKGKTLVVRYPGRRRYRRAGLPPCLLRDERPAAHGQGSRPRPRRNRGRGAAQGGRGQPRPCRRTDAGRSVDARRQGGSVGQGRRCPAVDRSDEDGNRAPRRTRWHCRRGARHRRKPDRRQGSAGGVWRLNSRCKHRNDHLAMPGVNGFPSL